LLQRRSDLLLNPAAIPDPGRAALSSRSASASAQSYINEPRASSRAVRLDLPFGGSEAVGAASGTERFFRRMQQLVRLNAVTLRARKEAGRREAQPPASAGTILRPPTGARCRAPATRWALGRSMLHTTRRRVIWTWHAPAKDVG